MTRRQYADWAGQTYEGVKGVVVHHYANEYDGIWNTALYHVFTKNYPTVGYSVIIQQDGTVNYCVPFDYATYHVAGRNHEFIGIAFTGNLSLHKPTNMQIWAFNWLYRHQRWVYPVYGHKEVALVGYSTACPGNTFHEWEHMLEGR